MSSQVPKKLCSSCGSEIPTGALRCRNCGLNGASSAQGVSQTKCRSCGFYYDGPKCTQCDFRYPEEESLNWGYAERFRKLNPGVTNFEGIATKPQRTNSWAIASLACSIVFCGPLGIVFGFISLSQIKSTGGTESGSGLATAGIVIGFLGLLLAAANYMLLNP